MSDAFSILGQNKDFLLGAYNLGPLVVFLGFLALLDLGLKGWGMWRAARMRKSVWFVALLFVNSAGILPAVFLLLTREEYQKLLHRDQLDAANAMATKAKKEMRMQ